MEIYEKIADVLEDVWINIDWDNIDSRRRMKIWSEFEAQVKALAKCYSQLQPFLDKLCRRFNSRLTKQQTKSILEDQKGTLNILRNETTIPVLILKLRQDAKKSNSL